MIDETSFNPRAAAMGMRKQGLPETKQRTLLDMFALPSATTRIAPRGQRPGMSPEDQANARFDKAQAERRLVHSIAGKVVGKAIGSYFGGPAGGAVGGYVGGKITGYAGPKIDAEHERGIRRIYGDKDQADTNLFRSSPVAFVTSPNVSDRDKIVTTATGGTTPNQIDSQLQSANRMFKDPYKEIMTNPTQNIVAQQIQNSNPLAPQIPQSWIPNPTSSNNKIVCTAMNECYGFGKFRQTIWLKHSATMPKEYEKGYHIIGLPLIDIAYKKKIPFISKMVKTIIEHIVRHRTVDLWAEMRNSKRDVLGRLYRIILEPICYYVGKGKV
jgi:uncharacterized protein YcfJ